MLNRQIEKSYQEVDRLNCCHQDGRPCCCYDCLKLGFHNEPDEYDCPKKLNYYIGKYAASYTSEIYNYLEKSRIIEKYRNKELRVLSLGCGFSPDYYAIRQYNEDYGLNITLEYKGFDSSPQWNNVRLRFSNLSFEIFDLTNEFRVNEFDMVFMNKVFSTLYKHSLHQVFLENLITAINLTSGDALVLVFNDVNSIYMGRDVFNSNISPKFTSERKFFTGNPLYKESNWEKIDNRMVFPVIRNDRIDPLNEIRNYIYFEYRK